MITNIIVSSLLQLEDELLDPRVKSLVEVWHQPPSALQVLESLDHCEFGGYGCDSVVLALELLFESRCEAEQLSKEQVYEKASWRQAA